MSAPCCAATNAAGQPCAARPLTESDFCLFHDPARHQALAESRSKGGAAPRRRTRRFPRVLDHVHVAELLGELLLDALNNPAALDTKRLAALTHLCQVLLKAVGTPKGSFLFHRPHTEPPATEDHLLRVYPSEPAASDLPPDAESEHPTPNTQHPTPDPEPLTESGDQTLHRSTPEEYRHSARPFSADAAVSDGPPLTPPTTLAAMDAARIAAAKRCTDWNDLSPERQAMILRPTPIDTSPSPFLVSAPARPTPQQPPEQDIYRLCTGAPGTNASSAPAAGFPGLSVSDPSAAAATAPSEPDPDSLSKNRPDSALTPIMNESVPPKPPLPPTGPPSMEPPVPRPTADPSAPAGPRPFLPVAGFVRRTTPYG